VSQACAGLAEAHALQIVHRDLKPSNLFLTRRSDGSPLIKLLDFGVAKVPQPEHAELTATNVALGSPGYMSPEQIRASKTADHRSDLWSLGVILFELVAGHRPFTSNGAAEPGAAPTPSLPEGPAALDPIIACCLARAPEYRYRDAGELAGVLAAFCEDRPVSRRRPSSRSGAASPPPAPSDGAPDPATTLSAGVIELPPRRRPARVTMSALLALCAGCAVVGLSMGHDPGLASSPAALLGASRDAAPPPAPPVAPPALEASDPPVAPGGFEAADRPAALEPSGTPAALEAPDRSPAEDSAPHGAPPAVQPVPSRRTPAPGPRRLVKPRPAPERVPGVVELSERRL
jgi:serine/threonine-protein kinase